MGGVYYVNGSTKGCTIQTYICKRAKLKASLPLFLGGITVLVKWCSKVRDWKIISHMIEPTANVGEVLGQLGVLTSPEK